MKIYQYLTHAFPIQGLLKPNFSQGHSITPETHNYWVGVLDSEGELEKYIFTWDLILVGHYRYTLGAHELFCVRCLVYS